MRNDDNLPVLATRASAGRASPSDVIALRIRTIRVPPYKNAFAFSSLFSRHFVKSSSLIGILLTGTLSPVSMLSLTIASPESRNRSAGTNEKSELDKLTISPGTRSVESHSVPVIR